ncbi:MAG TPA: hypothetical protein VKQ30_25600 [Ktedonobacterales bacterium]|jgi:hypothetical protein|nr:hypothetical protein [Ktedonobacterales bacterium]
MTTMMFEPRVKSRQEEQFRIQLLKAINTGRDAWSREARALLALAQERGIALDDNALIYSDVRDLQTIQTRLQVVRR